MLTELRTAAKSWSFTLAMSSAHQVCKRLGQSPARTWLGTKPTPSTSMAGDILDAGVGNDYIGGQRPSISRRCEARAGVAFDGHRGVQ
jgi:hypothetical protein